MLLAAAKVIVHSAVTKKITNFDSKRLFLEKRLKYFVGKFSKNYVEYLKILVLESCETLNWTEIYALQSYIFLFTKTRKLENASLCIEIHIALQQQP